MWEELDIHRRQQKTAKEEVKEVKAHGEGAMVSCVVSFLVVLVQLSQFLLTSAFPADLLCLGKEQNGQVHFKVTPDIIEEIHDCDIQWLVNGSVSALFDGNGKTTFQPPILNATVNMAIMENEREYKLEYIFICPSINVDKRVPCSCSNSTFLGSQPKNETFATEEGYPAWWIPVFVLALIVLLAVITLFVCKMVRKKYKQSVQQVENEIL